MAISDTSPATMPQPGPDRERRVLVLGSTGSIGTQTLDVIDHLNRLATATGDATRFRVVGLAAGRNAALLAEQAVRHNVSDIALACSSTAAAGDAPAMLRRAVGPDGRVLVGPEAAEDLLRSLRPDVVVAAMVGAAGLPATLAAVELGLDVALANKETLVAAGGLIVPAAQRSGARLLPVDSEHSALWQCLQACTPVTGRIVPPCPPMSHLPGVRRLILTASGGALRHLPPDEAARATPSMALRHPTWTMGAKVTIDSASLTNKAFELIEAHWLFGMPGDRLAVLIHPQSIVHSFVEFDDASLLAQLGTPDMKGPIQYALTFPARAPASARRIDPVALSRLEFSEPDPARYPALDLADRVIRDGGTGGAVFNASSEVAVEAFLAGHVEPGRSGAMTFGRLGELVQQVFEAIPVRPVRTLADVLEADAAARERAREVLGLRGVGLAPNAPVGGLG